MSDYVKDLLKEVKAKNPAEPEFHQAVTGSSRIIITSSRKTS